MRKTRFIGIVMIIASLIMQISYATTVTFADVSGGDYKVSFQKVNYYLNDESKYVSVNVQKTDDNNLSINVDNLYPGAYFTIQPFVQNYGYKTIKIVGFELNKISGNDRLFEMIVGVNSDGNEMSKVDYIKYLNEKYAETTLKFGETVDVMYSMGLSTKVTDLMNEKIVFEIIIKFEADSDSPPPIEPPVEPPTPPVEPPTPPVEPPTPPVEPPTPPVEPPNVSDPKSDNYIVEEIDNVHTEAINILPDTGDLSPSSIYILGSIAIIFGIILLLYDTRKYHC